MPETYWQTGRIFYAVVMFTILLVSIILYSTYTDAITGLIGAFLAGVIVDLWNGDRLGVSSIVLVSVSFMLNMYKRKFNPEHLIFLLPYTLITVATVVFINYDFSFEHSNIDKRLLEGGTGIIVGWYLFRICQHYFVKRSQSV